MNVCMYIIILPFYTPAELYTNVRYLSLEDKPKVPEGEYKRCDIEEAIQCHWMWMLDSFKVDSPIQSHTVIS